MYQLIRPILFRLPAERAHHIMLSVLSTAPGLVRLATSSIQPASSLKQTLWNMRFQHPIGLAAGLDKNGVAVDGFLRCGFSFVEVGTVTPVGQPGNPSPRLFRLLEDQALINRMGFNNEGAQALRRNLSRRRQSGVIGINLGKNKSTANDAAALDYVSLVETLYTLADYFVINVSSPNTPGLRDLQSEAALVPLVQAVVGARNSAYQRQQDKIRPHFAPVLVKLAPDLSNDAYTTLTPELVSAGADGFIATNTTLARTDLHSSLQSETGGLSGKPLRQRSTEVISLMYTATRGAVPIIGSGGVFTPDDAYEKILAGASLVQVYTGFVYKGPKLVADIVKGVAMRLQNDGYTTITEAVGAAHRR